MDEQSIWKKEISFRRKTAAERSSDSGDAATSIWKKEISFSRKRTGATPAPPPAPATPVAAPEQVEAAPVPAPVQAEPVAASPVTVPAQQAPPPPPEVPPPAMQPQLSAPPAQPSFAPPVSAPVATKPVPFWKREVVIGRRAKAKDTAARAQQPAAVSERTQPSAQPKPVPFWKREVVIGKRAPRRSKPATPRTEQPSAPRVEAVVPAPIVGELPTQLSVPSTIVPEPTPAVAAAAPVQAALPAMPKAPFWKREVSVGRKRSAKPTSAAAKEPKEKRSRAKRPKAAKVKIDRGSRGAKRLVGLKIGASQLSAARVANNGAAELLQVAREPLSPGVVAGGEVRDPEALATALKDFFSKHKLPKRGVRLGIANNRIGVRTFEVAGIQDKKQLENAIRFRAQEALPIPIDEAVLDYQVLGETTDDSGQPVRRILLVVAYRQQVDRYLEACKKAGITLVGIDLEAFALLRALQPPLERGDNASAALVAVAVGHERSTFAVSDGIICEFTRVLEWGGAALNVALARALDAAPSEVETIKRSLSLDDDATPEGLTPEQAAKARDAVRRAIQAFARELVSSLQYYQNQPGSLGIGEIVLTGGTAHLPGLATELQQLIGVHVRVGDPLARMKVSKRIKEPEQLGSLAVAIGLGIED